MFYDFGILEHHGVDIPHQHIVPTQHDLEKTYHEVMAHHPHGPMHSDPTKLMGLGHPQHHEDLQHVHMAPHHHHHMTQMEHDLSPHYIHHDLDAERELFEKEWATGHHMPITFAPAIKPTPVAHHPAHGQEHHQTEAPFIPIMDRHPHTEAPAYPIVDKRIQPHSFVDDHF